MRWGVGVRNPTAQTLHRAPTHDRRQPPSPPPYIHTPASLLPLVLPWLHWEAWPPVSTQPRLDSDPPTPPLPPPPALPRGEEALLAEPSKPHPDPRHVNSGRGARLPWPLTSASWTPGEAINRQGCRESCQCEQHPLRKK